MKLRKLKIRAAFAAAFGFLLLPTIAHAFFPPIDLYPRPITPRPIQVLPPDPFVPPVLPPVTPPPVVTPPAQVPEPTGVALALVGLGSAWVYRRTGRAKLAKS